MKQKPTQITQKEAEIAAHIRQNVRYNRDRRLLRDLRIGRGRIKDINRQQTRPVYRLLVILSFFGEIRRQIRIQIVQIASRRILRVGYRRVVFYIVALFRTLLQAVSVVFAVVKQAFNQILTVVQRVDELRTRLLVLRVEVRQDVIVAIAELDQKVLIAELQAVLLRVDAREVDRSRNERVFASANDRFVLARFLLVAVRVRTGLLLDKHSIDGNVGLGARLHL